MQQFLNSPIRAFFAYREERIVTLHTLALESQETWFTYLMKMGSKTLFGEKHGIDSKTTYREFTQKVPVYDYNALFPYIDRIVSGEKNILWPTPIEWLAKSSGTSQGKSKFVPVSDESLKENNITSAMDCLTIYTNLFPDTELFSGKTITLGGSMQELYKKSPLRCGDVSAILMENMHAIGFYLNAPQNKKILLHSNWEYKLRLMAKSTIKENVTGLSGVPSWMLLVLKEVLARSGKKSLSEVWPNIEVYFHGGVSFDPYRAEYEKIFSPKKLFYMNIYNASEGFFGIQNERDSDDMLLMTDNGVFYEFLELNEEGRDNGKVIPLSEVQVGPTYAMIVTTVAGLWRYEIGDTIQFTSIHPYKFRIAGRTTHFINAFGEELIVNNAEKAISEAALISDAIITNYSAAPLFLDENKTKGGHQWVVEFSKAPSSLELFASSLDNALKRLNSDYEAKRSGDLLMAPPKIEVVEEGTFIKWLELRNKLGGQYKVPRLQNNRKIVEELLMISNIISHPDRL